MIDFIHLKIFLFIYFCRLPNLYTYIITVKRPCSIVSAKHQARIAIGSSPTNLFEKIFEIVLVCVYYN